MFKRLFLVFITLFSISNIFFLSCHRDPRLFSDDEIWGLIKNPPNIKLYLFNTGHLKIDYDLMVENMNTGKKVWIPVPVYLIIHPKGTLLFDTGLHPLIATDPESRLGKGANVIDYNMDEGQDIVNQLESLGYSPNEIDFVINSHLHFDHAGCNEFFSQSTYLIQKKELKHAYSIEKKAFSYCRGDFDLPFKFHSIDGDYDVFGDKSIIILYTPGHTPGHQSLLLKLQSGPVILTADVCYLMKNILEPKLPKAVEDTVDAMKSLKRIRKYKENYSAMIFPGHDPEFWKGLKKAPDFYE